MTSKKRVSLGDLDVVWAAYASNLPAFEAAHKRHSDLLHREIEAGHLTYEEWGASPHIQNALIEEAGLQEPDAVNERTFNAYVELAERAMAQSNPPNDAELAAIANVCATANPELWSKPKGELDWDQRTTRRLVEAVLAMAGVPLILNGLPVPQPLSGNHF
jgi:hypothetical protein